MDRALAYCACLPRFDSGIIQLVLVYLRDTLAGAISMRTSNSKNCLVSTHLEIGK